MGPALPQTAVNPSNPDPASTPSKLWLWVLLAWVVQALFRVYLDPRPLLSDDAQMPTLWQELSSALVWTLITLALVALARHRWVERAAPLGWLGIHAVATLGVISARCLFIYFSDPYLYWYPGPIQLSEVFVDSTTNNFVASWLLIGVAHAVVQSQKSRQRASEIAALRASLATSQLEALRARLNPHFIFNALNSVAETMHRDVPRADQMLVSLSALLRDGLSNNQRPLRPLREELALVRHYLTMEQARLDERLSLSWQIDPQCLDHEVPVLILQPLVENAILHGIAPCTEKGELSIRAEAAVDGLRLRVENSVGAEAAQRRTTGTGNGLRSIRERLALLYGGAAKLAVRTAEADGHAQRFQVEISIPLADASANAWRVP